MSIFSFFNICDAQLVHLVLLREFSNTAEERGKEA